MSADRQHQASFRDPAGFVYLDKAGRLLRQVTTVGADDFELLHSSKLYDSLTQKGWLIPHHAVSDKQAKGAHAIVEPEKLPFITYPFEWSFSQLQDAALLTLQIQKEALKHGMTLKDASAYNVQFRQGKPLCIDTLSFEKYTAGTPWKAYRQFCQHFLAPLALMAYVDSRCAQLSRVHLDGIPLDLAAKLLPQRARLRAGLLLHIFLHAGAQRAKSKDHEPRTAQVSKAQLLAILGSLERIVSKLKLPHTASEWGDYYNNTNYSADAADQKAALVRAFAKPLSAKTALDIGGNNGTYSRVLNKLGITTVCSDIDSNAVEANYLHMRANNETAMMPLLIDFTNPGGALGWANAERDPVHERLQTDLVMSLAVIHHLAISNNLPLAHIAAYMSRFAPHLIIEFVPKSDSQVRKLLATREDIFPDYTEAGFKGAFGTCFTLLKEAKIPDTQRTLYLFKRK